MGAPIVAGTRKRSVTINGHPTSFSLEAAFLAALQEEAARRHLSLAHLVAMIDARRSAQTNLSSALRLYVLATLQARIAELTKGAP